MSQLTELEEQKIIKRSTRKATTRKTTKKKADEIEVPVNTELPSSASETPPKKRAVRKKAPGKAETEKPDTVSTDTAETTTAKTKTSATEKKSSAKAKTTRAKSTAAKKSAAKITAKKTEEKKTVRAGKKAVLKEELSLLDNPISSPANTQTEQTSPEAPASAETKEKSPRTAKRRTGITKKSGIAESSSTKKTPAAKTKSEKNVPEKFSQKNESSVVLETIPMQEEEGESALAALNTISMREPGSSSQDNNNVLPEENFNKTQNEQTKIAETDEFDDSQAEFFSNQKSSFPEPNNSIWENENNDAQQSLLKPSIEEDSRGNFFEIPQMNQNISKNSDMQPHDLSSSGINEQQEIVAPSTYPAEDANSDNFFDLPDKFEEFESDLPEFEKFARLSRKKDKRIRKENISSKNMALKRQKRNVPISAKKAAPKAKKKEKNIPYSIPSGTPYLLDPYTNELTMMPYSMDLPFQGRIEKTQKTKKPFKSVPQIPMDFDFNSAMLNDSILGTVFHKEEENLPEVDEPQPILPNQPDAFSMGNDKEENFEELDNAVNGNILEGFRHTSRKKELRLKRKTGIVKREFKKVPIQEKEITDIVPDQEMPPVRRVMLVSRIPDEQVEVAITENGQVAEYFIDMVHQEKIRGNIYKGIVCNIDTNLQAAFINFGTGRNGFLQIDEVHPEYYMCNAETETKSKLPPIQKALHLGQELLVQVVKEPAGSKGAFLTTWVSIAGRFLVLTPGQEQIGVSRKVEDPEERERLKCLMNGIQPGENMGVIIRTASEGASQNNIQQDLDFLKKLWDEIRNKAKKAPSPSLIYQEADLISRTMRDYVSESFEAIWTDDEEVKNRLDELINLMYPDNSKEIVKLYREQRLSLWDKFGLNRELETITSHEVYLPSGGRLVFDQTEALMAIDINSGRTQAKNNFEAMVFKTNMEAVEAIARHLRLRDIGGQIVIDFIEMRDKTHCRDIEKAMHFAMKRDRARHDIGHMSAFGLLELVRQRTGTSAISISCEPCPYCNGTGMRRNMEWRSMQVMRDMKMRMNKLHETLKRKSVSNSEPPVFFYETDPDLAMYVLNRKRDRLVELEEKFGLHIEIKQK